MALCERTLRGFLPAGRMSGGGLSLLADLTQDDIVRFLLRESQEFLKALRSIRLYSRSHDAVIRVYDDLGNVIETHGAQGRLQRAVARKPPLIPAVVRGAVIF